MTTAQLRYVPTTEVAAIVEQLRGEGARVLRGTFADNAGVLRAKQVPIHRAAAFHAPGVGAAPSWAVFAVDDAVVFTQRFGATGDIRLRADLDAVVGVGGGVALAPVELADQFGRPLDYCPRGALRRQQAGAEADGVEILAAIEVELTCFEGTTGLPTGGPAYGMAPLIRNSAFIDDVHELFQSAGLEIEQFHAEYGNGQIELSLEPMAPLDAADANVLAKVLLCTVARRHGLALSWSPQPLFDGIGNGAHVHLSFTQGGRPLLSGGPAPQQLTDDGAAVVATLVSRLPEAVGMLAPSLLSAARLQPGHWSGAYACWGVENREAAVRLCQATPGNVHGAHLEVKCVDPSANPYTALATLCGLARHGLHGTTALPPEVTVPPGMLSDDERDASGAVRLCDSQESALDAADASALLRQILGDGLVDAHLAVRRHELELAKSESPEDLVERFRFAWSA
ncbi:MAG: glutamine synthetase family protein [Actinomycetota bacterium]|jgi:glutamine synthetase|nr:glutamine synthetase family protein [Actinomycetota bacterium]